MEVISGIRWNIYQQYRKSGFRHSMQLSTMAMTYPRLRLIFPKHRCRRTSIQELVSVNSNPMCLNDTRNFQHAIAQADKFHFSTFSHANYSMSEIIASFGKML